MPPVKVSIQAPIVTLLLLSGCAGPEVIPQELRDQVDKEITFAKLIEDPDSFEGRLIVMGGVVLSATLLKEGTRIEVLQLPLQPSHEPETDLRASQGRFLAFEEGFLDPATLPNGTGITVVGEVTGAARLPLDEREYTYPTLAVKKLTVWPKMMPAYWFRPYPYFGAYWGPYWGHYWGPLPAVP